MKKVIISDYDKTFYISNEDIEKNKKTINQFREQGNLFMIATGRSFWDFKNKVAAYNLEYNYVILNHGATILDNNDNILYNASINDNVIKDIKEDLQLPKSIRHFCCSKLESRVDFNYKDLTKINVKYNEEIDAIKINELMNKKYGEYVNSYYIGKNSIEIISNKTNKSKAIKLLMDKIEINTHEIYTIGDGYSDIQMVKDFKGYCMKDSVKELKDVAIKEYDSVSELVKDILNNIV